MLPLSSPLVPPHLMAVLQDTQQGKTHVHHELHLGIFGHKVGVGPQALSYPHSQTRTNQRRPFMHSISCALGDTRCFPCEDIPRHMPSSNRAGEGHLAQQMSKNLPQPEQSGAFFLAFFFRGRPKNQASQSRFSRGGSCFLHRIGPWGG